MSEPVRAASVILFRREQATAELCAEIWPLLELHYQEVARFKDIALNPDFDLYCKMDEMGVLRVFVARERGAILGYCIFFVKENPHYKDSKQATQDIIFIHPKHRGFGAKFILWCESQLRDEGVEVVYHRTKEKADLNFGQMLDRLGYEKIDVVYAKRI